MSQIQNSICHVLYPPNPPVDRVKPSYYAHGSNFQRTQFLLLYLVNFCNKFCIAPQFYFFLIFWYFLYNLLTFVINFYTLIGYYFGPLNI